VALPHETRAHGSSARDKASDPSDLPTHVQEAVRLVVAYVKQETVDPIRGLGRFLGFGLAGSVLVGLGGLIFLLGVLRLLQTETGDTFAARWSFAPYLLTLVACALVAGAAMAARRQPGRDKEGR
jgi:hypothetical protein